MAVKQKRIPPLDLDPEWAGFVKRYAFDLTAFAIEVCGMDVTWQQEALFDLASEFGCRVSVSSGHGCFAKGTEIMRADGSVVPVESVREGERLMGGDGASTRTVLGLKRGREAMYRFTYADGTSHVFNESHILCLVATNSKGRRVAGARTTVTVREWLTWGEDKKRCHAIYRSGVDQFARAPEALPVPPYVFGAWLGDGDSNAPSFTTADPEIVEAIREWADSLGCQARVSECNAGRALRYYVTNGKVGPGHGPARAALRATGALNDKHIPPAYLYAPKADRLELLAGLIDTDGHCDKGSTGFDVVQKSERLARQIAWLARSVGCHATVKAVTKRCCNNGATSTYWRVTIGRNIDQIPVRIARKRHATGPRQRGNLHFSIRSCEPLGEGDYYGFLLDGDHRFLGGDFTVLHNTGKTRSFGVIALWHLLCYRDSNTYLTAPKLKTVREGVWKEMATLREQILKGPHAWIVDYLEIGAEKVYVKGCSKTWFITARTAPRGSPENLAGTHGQYLLWIADEASGIPDANFGVIGGAMTDERNRFIMASQPTRPAGFFRDTHEGKLNKRQGGDWDALVFSSEESPIVSDKFLREKLVQYGGRGSPEYQVKVLGRFPTQSDKYLMSRPELERCLRLAPVVDTEQPYGHLVMVDVSAAQHRDRTVAVHARVQGDGDRLAPNPRRLEVVDVPVYSNALDWTPCARIIADYVAGLSNCVVLVDCHGMGSQFARRLEEFGVRNIVEVTWGSQPFNAEYAKRFYNQRAQCTVHLAEAVKDGRLKLLAKHETDLLDQGSRLPFGFDEHGRWRIAKKVDMAKEGLPSPDLLDCLAMGFLEDAIYIPAKDDRRAVDTKRSRRNRALVAAKEALSA